jgi:hypothetical protein
MRRYGVLSSEAVVVQILDQQYGNTVVMITYDPKAAEYATHQLM